MKNEINEFFYCSCGIEAGGFGFCAHAFHNNRRNNCRNDCPNRLHKHPTPEQFKEEYGEEYPDDGAVYELDENHWPIDRKWFVGTKKHCGKNSIIVCACTPFSMPDDTWRPQ